MHAIEICSHLKRDIETGNIRRGQIHSIFSRACNIISHDRLVTLLKEDKPMAPYCIKVKPYSQNFYDFNPLIIYGGSSVNFSLKGLRLQSQVASFTHNIDFDLHNLNMWKPQPIFDFKKDKLENVYKKMEISYHYLYHKGNLEGMGALFFNLDLNQAQQFISKRLITFIECAKKMDKIHISKATSSIIGFGLGLTPSTDDFITGLMIANVYFADYFNKDKRDILSFNEEMIKAVAGKTTLVSENQLRDAARGEVNQTVRNYIINLLSVVDDQGFYSGLEDLVRIGNTSGSDLLCGILIGASNILNS
ncbi:DUF2877 domain-containing protein [Alkaliphilus transvaalensis]|uniref:DUF2877 domain-containing protein n=1 Tax=Alkaliphilus transvaalensis TaxID=114628 RepID=UPI00047BA5F1|nr:DUF2877 domain-containing protein [Alkaliphilus transvaalensis]